MKFSAVSLKGGQVLLGKGSKTFLKAPHTSLPSWYTPDFFLKSENPWYIHETYEIIEKTDRPFKTAGRKGSPEPFDAMYQSMTIQKGVVYTRCPVFDFDPHQAFANLLKNNKMAYIYATEGMMGATPELLFDLQEDSLETVALAATAEKAQALQAAKEQEEQQIVITAIRDALRPLGSVEVGVQIYKPYGKLLHLATPIFLRKKLSFEEAVKVLHPTPAVGAWPKKEGRDWLIAQEARLPRHRFAAPFGYVYPARNEARAFVAIRCIQWDETSAHLWAGVGVTAKSLLENEWREVLNKFEATANLMGLLEGV